MSQLIEQFERFASVVPATRPDELALYQRHFDLLHHWNEQFNLVSRNAFEKAFANHYLDSVLVSDVAVAHTEGRALFDVGSGAGFPGLICAIRYPDRPIQLYEKSLKKQSFLSTAVVQLELKNIQVKGLFGAERVRGLVLARAVFPPDKLFKFMSSSLEPKSRVVLQRGGMSEAPKVPAGFRALRSVRYDLPMECGARFAEVFEVVPRGTK